MRGAAALLIASSVLPGCGGSDRTSDDLRTGSPSSAAPSADPNAFDLTDVPPEQHFALQDGKLTAAEYREGFENFRDCSAEAGIEISGGSEDPDTGQIRYSYPAERPGYEQGEDPLVNAVEECYVTYFRSIDATFQTTSSAILVERRQEEVEFFEEFVKPCLDANGVDHPEMLPVESDDREAYVAVMKPFFELVESGRCE